MPQFGASRKRLGQARTDRGVREQTGASGGKSGGERGQMGLPFPKWENQKLLLAVVLNILDVASRSSRYSGLAAPDAPTEF